MQLRKLTNIAIACIIGGTFFTFHNMEKEDTQRYQAGILAKLNESEEDFNYIVTKFEKKIKIPHMYLLHQYHYYPSLDSMFEALKNNEIEEICTYRRVANYLMEKNPNLVFMPHSIGMPESFCFAVRKEDTALCENLNSAIAEMKDAGTLDYITKSYIIYLNPNDEMPSIEIPKIEGAETLKVGVTGDFPPFDLILEDGKPAGFSVRLMQNISKILNKNIEFVKISSTERATALINKKIDVAFWVTVATDKLETNIPVTKMIDVTDSLAVTDTYYEDEVVHIAFKNQGKVVSN